MAKTKKSRKQTENTPHPWIGKTLLAGLTWLSEQGRVISQKQVYGAITQINPDEHSMEVDQPNGEFWTVPYYPETVMQARRGKYRCTSTGQEVVNPDLVTSWRLIQTEVGQFRGWQPNYLLYSEPVQPREWEFTPTYEREYLLYDIHQRGEQFIGKHLLIGIQYFEAEEGNPNGKFVGQEQRHGVIVRANPEDGIVLQLPDGSEFKMPPDLTMLEPAPRAEYRLRSTGEVVVNPDYGAAWAVYRDNKKP